MLYGKRSSIKRRRRGPRRWFFFHIHTAFDLTDKPTEEEQAATKTAIDTLLDFMCCEVDQDHEALGKHFQASANIVFDKRRYRTGIVEA